MASFASAPSRNQHGLTLSLCCESTSIWATTTTTTTSTSHSSDDDKTTFPSLVFDDLVLPSVHRSPSSVVQNNTEEQQQQQLHNPTQAFVDGGVSLTPQVGLAFVMPPTVMPTAPTTTTIASSCKIDDNRKKHGDICKLPSPIIRPDNNNTNTNSNNSDTHTTSLLPSPACSQIQLQSQQNIKSNEDSRVLVTTTATSLFTGAPPPPPPPPPPPLPPASALIRVGGIRIQDPCKIPPHVLHDTRQGNDTWRRNYHRPSIRTTHDGTMMTTTRTPSITTPDPACKSLMANYISPSSVPNPQQQQQLQTQQQLSNVSAHPQRYPPMHHSLFHLPPVVYGVAMLPAVWPLSPAVAASSSAVWPIMMMPTTTPPVSDTPLLSSHHSLSSPFKPPSPEHRVAVAHKQVAADDSSECRTVTPSTTTTSTINETTLSNVSSVSSTSLCPAVPPHVAHQHHLLPMPFMTPPLCVSSSFPVATTFNASHTGVDGTSSTTCASSAHMNNNHPLNPMHYFVGHQQQPLPPPPPFMMNTSTGACSRTCASVNNGHGLEVGKRYSGTVRRFNPNRGFGFIRADCGIDIFMHESEIVDDSAKNNEKEEKKQEEEATGGSTSMGDGGEVSSRAEGGSSLPVVVPSPRYHLISGNRVSFVVAHVMNTLQATVIAREKRSFVALAAKEHQKMSGK